MRWAIAAVVVLGGCASGGAPVPRPTDSEVPVPARVAVGREARGDSIRVRVRAVRSWSSGEPGPLPVRIAFVNSTPDGPLNRATVLRAAIEAMLSAGLPPDVLVRSQTEPRQEGRRYLRIEVDTYGN